MMIYPFDLPPTEGLTLRQLDGQSCIYCDGCMGAMRAVGLLRGVLVFAHYDCAELHRITDDTP